MAYNFGYSGDLGINNISSQQTVKAVPKTTSSNYPVNFANIINQQINTPISTSTSASNPINNSVTIPVNTVATNFYVNNKAANITSTYLNNNFSSVLNTSLGSNLNTVSSVQPKTSLTAFNSSSLLSQDFTNTIPSYTNTNSISSPNIATLNFGNFNQFNSGKVFSIPQFSFSNFNNNVQLNSSTLVHLADFNKAEVTKVEEVAKPIQLTPNNLSNANIANQGVQLKDSQIKTINTISNRVANAETGMSQKVSETSAKASEKTDKTAPAQNKPLSEMKNKEEMPKYKLSFEPVLRDENGNKVNLKDTVLKAFATRKEILENKAEKVKTNSEFSPLKTDDKKMNQIKELLVNIAKVKDGIKRINETDLNIIANMSTSRAKSKEEEKYQIENVEKEEQAEEQVIGKVEERGADEETGKNRRDI